eukprot:1177097-Prorocentrum_minimum.AAC.2
MALCYAWGLLASLTPCVYPMLPTTVAMFAGENAHHNNGGTEASTDNAREEGHPANGEVRACQGFRSDWFTTRICPHVLRPIGS